jgi:Flp pilus assembly protein TadG
MHCRKLKNRRRRGSTMLEFVLVGIALMFIWITVLEMARGMWQYHTLQYAVKQTAQYATKHGASCASPNTCEVTVGNVVNVFSYYAGVLPLNSVQLSLTSSSGTVTCAVVSTCSTNGSWNTQWPPSGANAVGADIWVSANYTFTSALLLFIPTNGTVRFGSSLGGGAFNFPGYSHMQIVF